MKCIHGNEGARVSSPDYGNGAGIVCYCYGQRTEVNSRSMPNREEAEAAASASKQESTGNARGRTP
jgi:hypothetical protein